MDCNYILLPENIQRRPLPGHRHRSTKARKVSSEAFSPISRVGRRVPGEVKAEAKNVEERSGADLARFVKKLNRVLAARPAHAAGEQVDLGLAPGPIDTCNRGIYEGPPSQLLQKRAFSESPKSSADALIETRVAKRARSNAISSSSRVKLEDMPRPLSPTNQTEEIVLPANNHDLYHRLPPTTSTVQPHAPFGQLQPMVLPTFSDHGTAPHLINQPNYDSPGAEIPQHLAHDFHLNTGPAHDHWLNYEVHLERIATACAYAGMSEPMDVDTELPTLVPHNDYPDLDLERIAVACAYAAMDEPMDITEDDTQGPIYHFAPQETNLFNPPAFTQYLPVQQQHFHVGLAPRPPIDETVFRPEHQHFIDQDQRLHPPIGPHPLDQFFHHPQPARQEFFIMNQTFPLHPPVQAHHNLPAQEYFPVDQRFDIAYHQPLAVHQNEYILPQPHMLLPPIIHDQLANQQFIPNFRVHEEATNVLPTEPLVDGGFVNRQWTAHQVVDDAGHEDEGGYNPGYHQVFVDDEVEAGVAPANDEGLFEELFGGDEDDDDESEDDDDEPEIII